MKTKNSRSLSRAILYAAIGTAAVSLVPLVAMQLTHEVNWDVIDFIIIGGLLFSVGMIYQLVARKVARKYQIVIGIVLAAVLIYIWAELAVGIFTTFGS